MEKLNIEVRAGQVAKPETINRTTAKVDEIVDYLNDQHNENVSQGEFQEHLSEVENERAETSEYRRNVDQTLLTIGQRIDNLGNTLITKAEYNAIKKKELRYYYVAKDEAGKMADKLWRVYLQNRPIFEFDENGHVSTCFPICFPTVLCG